MSPRNCFALAGLCLAAVGCGPRPPEITMLTGRVTLDGKPLGAGSVTVLSDDDVVQTTGMIGDDATYAIFGAPVGPVRFAVNTRDYKMIVPEPDTGERPRPNPNYRPLPSKYDSPATSGLAGVIPSGKATFDLALSSK